jgi:hypothetical protein
MAQFERACRTCLFAKGEFCRLNGTPVMRIGACYQHILVWTSPRDDKNEQTRELEKI